MYSVYFLCRKGYGDSKGNNRRITPKLKTSNFKEEEEASERQRGRS